MKLHPALAETLKGVVSKANPGTDCAAQDMSPEDWKGLVQGFLKFISEEEKEPDHAPGATDEPADPSGALTEAERAEAAKGHAAREDMPASAFLDQAERKYPFKEQRDGEWKVSRNLLLAAAREARMHGHEELAARADKIRGGMAQDHDVFALDAEPENRTKTTDGRLLIKVSNFSKANTCPYLGNEIPDWESLGLDPKKVYQLYRDPVELKKAAPTFDKVPVLIRHVASTADDHPTDDVIGTTGDKTRFVDPYLQGSIAIWDQAGIDAIESKRQTEISCGYRYTPIMVAGTAPDGTHFDGRMTALIGNHLALVESGRAGSDCVVGDSLPFIAGWDEIEAALVCLV